MTEKVAYVWSINAKWTQLDKDDKEKRIDNGTGFHKGFPEVQTEEEVLKYATEWWQKYSTNEKFKDLNPELVKLNVKFDGEQTWWLEWFNHISFNEFPSEEAAFESFTKFLQSKNVDIRYSSSSEHWSPFKENAYCAMGGEDRWRWELCTCKHCKEQKVTRIKH